jgi:hypothetical protein
MDKEYVFPKDNWYLKFEECDRELVDDWRINIIKYSDKPCPSNYINWGGRVGGEEGFVWLGQVLITIDQFKKHVLNIQELIIEQQAEDLSYLIDFLNQKINK